MIRTIQFLEVLLPIAYLACAVLHGMAFGGGRAPRVTRWRKGFVRGTLALHLAALVARALQIHQFPIGDLWTTVSATALSTAFLYALVARMSAHPGSGGVVLGFVFLLQFLSAAFGSFVPHARPHGFGTFQLAHIVTSVVSTAALVLSGLHGFLYLVLFREMRERRFGALFDHLPDLDVLSKMMRRAALLGFLGLTIGLNAGIYLAHAEKRANFDYRHPEVLLSLLLWVYFGAIAFSVKVPGFSARRASYAAAGGLLALLCSLFLVLLPNHFHSAL
jgi:ABC-type uncharacterized transport system permease subunit